MGERAGGLDLGVGGVGPMAVFALAGLEPSRLAESELGEVIGLIDEQVGWLHSLRAAHLVELASRHAGDVAEEMAPLGPGEWRDGRAEAPDSQWEREVVGLRCAITDFEARVRLDTATALATRLPATARLLGVGAVSWAHAVSLAQETAGLEPVECGQVERHVHADGRARTAGQYRRRAARLTAALRPVPDPDTEPGRSLEAWGDRAGVELRVRLTLEGGAIVGTALDTLAGRTDPGDDRPVGVRRADALVELAQAHLDRGALPAGLSGARPHLTLQVPLATLLGADDMPAPVGGTGLSGPVDLPAVALRRIACDADIATLTHTAAVVDLGRARRLPSPALRRRLEARDGGCRFPTCTRPVGRCHAHHVRHWADGGPTDEENLLLVCSRHHHLLHEGRWQVTFDGTTATWRTPHGHHYLAPAPLARPPEPDPGFYAWLPEPPSSAESTFTPPSLAAPQRLPAAVASHPYEVPPF